MQLKAKTILFLVPRKLTYCKAALASFALDNYYNLALDILHVKQISHLSELNQMILKYIWHLLGLGGGGKTSEELEAEYNYSLLSQYPLHSEQQSEEGFSSHSIRISVQDLHPGQLQNVILQLSRGPQSQRVGKNERFRLLHQQSEVLS